VSRRTTYHISCAHAASWSPFLFVRSPLQLMSSASHPLFSPPPLDLPAAPDRPGLVAADGQPNFTWDTLRRLQQQQREQREQQQQQQQAKHDNPRAPAPAPAAAQRWAVVVGQDQARWIPKWRDSAALLRAASLWVVPRPAAAAAAADATEADAAEAEGAGAAPLNHGSSLRQRDDGWAARQQASELWLGVYGVLAGGAGSADASSSSAGGGSACPPLIACAEGGGAVEAAVAAALCGYGPEGGREAFRWLGGGGGWPSAGEILMSL
jgi:hypothetical protein